VTQQLDAHVAFGTQENEFAPSGIWLRQEHFTFKPSFTLDVCALFPTNSMQMPFGDMPGAHGSDGQESNSESDDDDDSKESHVPQLLFSLRYTKVIEPEKVRCSRCNLVDASAGLVILRQRMRC